MSHPLGNDQSTDRAGLINSIIGAITGSMVSFIVPALAYNLYYMRSAQARVMAPKRPPRCAQNVIILEQWRIWTRALQPRQAAFKMQSCAAARFLCVCTYSSLLSSNACVSAVARGLPLQGLFELQW